MYALYHEVLYRPILNLMVGLYDLLFHDLGLVILAITVLVRLLIWPLTHRALQNQKVMLELQPKLNAVKAKYKDDREAQAKAMMELYKTEKVSPFSSCLPLLIQLPLFIALYRVLSVGLKSEQLQGLYAFVPNPGVLATKSLGFLDLAAPSIAIAVLAAAAQFLQAKMMSRKEPAVHTEGSKDEDTMAIMNKQMLYMMPVLTLIIGWKLPAGLTLYWLFSNVAMIVQQYFVLKKKEQA